MQRYVALLRGIGPGDPRMANDKLRKFFEQLGFKNVHSIISSGNIVFDSDITDADAIESMVEEALPKKLGFSRTTIIRSERQIRALVSNNPFKNLKHGPSSYLMVTFSKRPISPVFELPYQPAGKPYKFIAVVDGTLFSATDNTVTKTSDLMTWLERQFGKEITSRTWLTVNRILKKMSEIK